MRTISFTPTSFGSDLASLISISVDLSRYPYDLINAMLQGTMVHVCGAFLRVARTTDGMDTFLVFQPSLIHDITPQTSHEPHFPIY